jgi:gas vesicle structural protein
MDHGEDVSLEDQQLVLGDLLNTVLDKGVVISGQVTISIADIDLLMLDLRLLLSSVQTALEHQGLGGNGDLSLLRADARQD